MADYYVFDAFGTAHRSQPTIVGLPRVMRSVAGLLMEKEVAALSKVLTDAPGPVTFVLGGTKVDDSLAVAKNALEAGIADNVIFTGVVANVVYLAAGKNIGKPSTGLVHSLGYDSEIDKASELLKKFEEKIVTPDYVAVKEDGERVEYPVDSIPEDMGIMDLGIESLVELTGIISSSGTVVLNGPAGVFEDELFSAGTFELIRASAKADFSVVGGGHTAAVIEKMGVDDKFSHISTGGGACIEFLTGKKLPAVEALEYSKEKFW